MMLMMVAVLATQKSAHLKDYRASTIFRVYYAIFIRIPRAQIEFCTVA